MPQIPRASGKYKKFFIVGLIVGRVRKPVLACDKYTAFIISKASPL
jgi:hypothetical protein